MKKSEYEQILEAQRNEINALELKAESWDVYQNGLRQAIVSRMGTRYQKEFDTLPIESLENMCQFITGKKGI